MKPAKPKVRFVTRKWGPTIGGMEKYCLRLCDELSQYIELEVIALSGRSKNKKPSAISLCTFGLVTAVKLVTRPTVNTTHIGDMACWPLAWIAKMRNPAGVLVISIHGSDITYGSRKGIMSLLYSIYLRLGARAVGSSKVVSNSYWLANRAQKYGFQNLTVIPLGTDFNDRELTLSANHNGSIFFAGRLIQSKGLSFIVKQVLPLLPDDMNLRVAGTLVDRSEVDVLQHCGVEFLGSLSTDELYREYVNAMCVVVPSQSEEGFGLIAAEAACAGGVVIASAHSGLLEVCADGVGCLAETSVPESWAEWILSIRGWGSGKRKSWIDSSTRAARDKYSWKAVAEQTFRLYDLD